MSCYSRDQCFVYILNLSKNPYITVTAILTTQSTTQTEDGKPVLRMCVCVSVAKEKEIRLNLVTFLAMVSIVTLKTVATVLIISYIDDTFAI